MGRIFGISNLPVSTIGSVLEPVQKLIPDAYPKHLKHFKKNTLLKSQLQDTFVKNNKSKQPLAK